jgi:ATP adenylyltransferase
MDRMWAPWRMAYLRKHSDKTPCFICAAVRQKRDRANLIVARGRTCLTMLNRFPYNVGHLMVAPLSHKADLAALTDEERAELLRAAAVAQNALHGAFKPHGYNLGINLGRVAGAGLLGHVHLHIVPRWDGDTNFMPVTGETKVMPMSLREAYAAIARHM